MEKVLSITDRIEDKKRQKQIKSNRNKFDAVQRVLQCGSCQLKCAMCGRHAEEGQASNSDKKVQREFRLCESCAAEFEDFIRVSEENRKPNDIFWHNREWLEMWSCWVAYQRSLNRFRKSLNIMQLPDNERT